MDVATKTWYCYKVVKGLKALLGCFVCSHLGDFLLHPVSQCTTFWLEFILRYTGLGLGVQYYRIVSVSIFIFLYIALRLCTFMFLFILFYLFFLSVFFFLSFQTVAFLLL